MITKINSVAINWLEWIKIDVEVDVSNWMTSFSIVWLGDAAIQESRERVRTAIKNSWYWFPGTRITVNLAPADIKKKWPSFDLPIAIWILSDDFTFDKNFINKSLFLWELALDWKLRPINSVLPSAIFAKNNSFEYMFIPEENKDEASLIPDIKIIPVQNLSQIVDILTRKIEPVFAKNIKIKEYIWKDNIHDWLDFSLIIWQEQAKRALLIASAGWHNILMEWPPWSGKTMLAKTFSSILPEMSLSEVIEVSKIYSVAWLLSKKNPLIFRRPFRKIHHTASIVSIIWWWRDSRPWEISLAHKWVLFLDEFLEFDSRLIETLRQPLEDWEITINRINASYKYPARFTFVWALNPCPCWYLWDKEKSCICSQTSIEKYRSKLSWPILDRIDIFINVPRIKIEDFDQNKSKRITSTEMKKNIERVRKIQLERFEGFDFTFNSEMTNNEIGKFCILETDAEDFLKNAIQKLNLSTRVYFRLLKISRTIADLDFCKKIKLSHIAEALSYRKV
ncbi:MAG: hypothetical protein ACD_4C00011G0003 [uncultured bacterium (gcode 4)]|uniref:Uncharacterized protein n=1 Tax=uncultured bacterium (gcode 4) TaxID=1234023 RepID=K2GV66_9BACT|nr:MAG: hypothetical protein ACD_4C00011G0003 [uncultured bacterium (gcode 4)]